MLGWFTGKKNQKEVEKVQKKSSPYDDTDDVDKDDVEDEELEAKGFDPAEAYPDIKDKEDECITDFSQVDYPDYLDIPAEQMFEIMISYEFQPASGPIRHEEGHSKGGRICSDQKIVSKSRSAGKEILKSIGKKLLSGSLNLTQISFPIRVMIPKSALETAVHATAIFPIFITKAAFQPDHLERFKLVITSTLSSFYWTNTFLKPLNPILGETLEATYNDGTQIFVEQISHHPPVSYFLIIGPNRMYKYFGYYLVEGKASLNKLHVISFDINQILNKGKRSIVFKDGQRIDFDFSNETYSGTFLGQLRTESIGKINFKDNENDFKCVVEFGKVKKQPSDFFQSDITQDGVKVATVSGTYLGFIDIDDKRYWDHRQLTPFRIKMSDKPLLSDHRIRSDLKTLRDGDVIKAQLEKERLEVIQRNDRKLREAYAKLQK